MTGFGIERRPSLTERSTGAAAGATGMAEAAGPPMAPGTEGGGGGGEAVTPASRRDARHGRRLLRGRRAPPEELAPEDQDDSDDDHRVRDVERGPLPRLGRLPVHEHEVAD